MLRENDLEVEGLFEGLSEGGVSGAMRTVFSPSWERFFPLELFCGRRFFMDDINFAELGLGGNPFIVELGLGMSIRAKLDNVFSKDLTGTYKEKRFGRFGCCIKVPSSPSSF